MLHLFNNYWLDLDLRLGAWNQGPFTQTPKPRNQDVDRSWTTNLEPGANICAEALGFVWHAVWRYFTQMILFVWKYSLQINIDIKFDINVS